MMSEATGAEIQNIELSRRQALVITAAAACACACCGTEAKAENEKPPEKAPPTLEVGKVDKYDKDQVYDEFRRQRVIVSRVDGKIFAFTSSCPHKGCAVKATEKSDSLICPCHKATFTEHGVVTKGPAKQSLFHYGITKKEDGTIVIDTTKQFSDKEWDKEGAFIEVEKPKN